jgi:hypothetical protein
MEILEQFSDCQLLKEVSALLIYLIAPRTPSSLPGELMEMLMDWGQQWISEAMSHRK